MDGADDSSIQSILEFNLQGHFHLLLVMKAALPKRLVFTALNVRTIRRVTSCKEKSRACLEMGNGPPKHFKTESTRTSSNIYLSWTKIEYQNNLNPIALFSTVNKR